jgi:cytochrome P450
LLKLSLLILQMLLLCISALLVILYLLCNRQFSYWKLKKVPFDKPFLFFGSFFYVTFRKEHIFDRIRVIYNKFSTPYVGIYIFHQPVLSVRIPELVKRVLVKDFDKFVNRNVARNLSADPLAFYTLFISKDEIWRCLRSNFSSAFTPLKMKMMSSSIKECAENLSCYLSSHSGETLEIKCVMKKFSTDITCSYAFGIETSCLHHEDSKIFKMATRLVDTTTFIRSVSILSYFFLPRLVDIFKLTFLDKPATDYFCNLFKETLKLR